jgi:CheY-like chemotaxis protein
MSAPLILAIHPDRRQAPKIAAIARHASAELLLAESMERAIAMLSERLPDLILTPTLLSHRDETALAERLRELGDVAAHVQTLTIPIFETTASTSHKGGVLSSLRKQRKGKAHAAQTVGCTVDTFAEQVVIYLIRAVEARIARPAVQTPTPAPAPEPTNEPAWNEPTNEAQTENAEGPAKAGHYVHGPQNDERHLDPRSMADELPTIEQLSARTPAVPEPVRSVDTRMDTIAAIVPAVSTIELPAAAPINTGVNAIAAIERNHAVPAQDCPAPAAIPRVAQLFMEVRSLERAALGHVVHALPAPAAIETGIERVEALVPVVKSASAAPPVPIPSLPSRVADVATQLLRVEADSHIHAAVPGVPALPTGSVEMSMAAVAAMLPVSATASERMLPAPAVVSPLAELQMELPPVTATGDAALPIVPESGGSESVAALAAMASVVRTVAVDRPLPTPVAITPTANLPMTLMPAVTAFATQAVAPVVPESDRSIGLSTQVVAAIVPLAADQAHTLAEIPATPMRVAELSMQLPSQGIVANTPVLPELPTGPTGASADAVAAITPLARAAAHQAFVPVPAAAPQVMELTIQLPPLAAARDAQAHVLAAPQASAVVIKADIAVAPIGEVVSSSLAVPQTSAPAIKADIAVAPISEIVSPSRAASAAIHKADIAAAPVAEVLSPSPDEAQAPPAPAHAPTNIHRKTKKKSTLQARKTARKNARKPDRLDDVSIFDPDECRFAALVAKLDEVVLRGEESQTSGANGGPPPQGRKPARSGKNKH